ncbi:translation initiation factor Sui1 [Pseudohaliea rubra]|uniref:Translation initiation factor SUI1-related protein n=1 Tax=Pseudohaliea rubra DSM 19751 TaxID=1265313 RepID=A0A095XX43_9GAMM|nr:translation initiation factor Sui1 [Pseudohaliea rubra]KGE04266.1 Translation initiation factor SUI1-related protein [Pseudohaliea rubra DSM 19751]
MAGRIVYRTDSGRSCPDCGAPQSACRCADSPAAGAGDGIVRLRRERKGRGGKAVTVVDGVPLPAPALKALAKRLKQRCGVGGAVKDGVIEIQGDQRALLKDLLEAEGFMVKMAGG